MKQTNRQYKDRLFKAIFGRNTAQSKQWRLDLYNALNGTDYKDPDALKLTTIENVISVRTAVQLQSKHAVAWIDVFCTVVSDVSFRKGKRLIW